MKNYQDYQSDLMYEAKNWIPFNECSKQEYYNQELKIMPVIEKLMADKCIYDSCFDVEKKEFSDVNTGQVRLRKSEISKMLHKELLFRLYRERCGKNRSDIKTEIYSKIREALKNYSYAENNDLEMFLVKSIPINYLKPFEALNILGLEWCSDKEMEEYTRCRAKANVYVSELCYSMYQNYDEDDVHALILKMEDELEKYKPEFQKLGNFVSARMKLRMFTIFAEKNGVKYAKRKILDNREYGVIRIDPIMLKIGKIKMSGGDMEEDSLSKTLKTGQYALTTNKIYFSKEDIGKEVRIQYIENAEVKEQQRKEKLQDEMDEHTKQENINAERIVIELAARVLNYEEVYNGAGKRNEKQKERKKICFTEKLVRSVKKYYYDENGNLESDAKRVVDSEYLDFFMSEGNLLKREFWLKKLQEASLKRNCDIWENGNNEELQWNGKGWLEAKVPISYFANVKKTNVANSTISEFREAYIKWLGLSAKNEGLINN